jgi:hypothetical protein
MAMETTLESTINPMESTIESNIDPMAMSASVMAVAVTINSMAASVAAAAVLIESMAASKINSFSVEEATIDSIAAMAAAIDLMVVAVNLAESTFKLMAEVVTIAADAIDLMVASGKANEFGLANDSLAASGRANSNATMTGATTRMAIVSRNHRKRNPPKWLNGDDFDLCQDNSSHKSKDLTIINCG